ncbi:MAG: hypothetical protein V4772_08575 [Pseudomonadota bacterium]
MNYTEELKQFTLAQIGKKPMNFNGDEKRFFSLRTARAWTKWIQAARIASNAI